MVCINAYRLYQLHTIDTRPLTHLQFRTELYCKLLGYSKEAKLRSLQLGLGGKRVFNPDLQHLHYWEKRPTQKNCVWCTYISKRRKVLEKGIRKQEIIKRAREGCAFCNVPLCKKGDCWERFHSINVND